MSTSEIVKLLPKKAKSISYDIESGMWFVNYKEKEAKASYFTKIKLRRGLRKLKQIEDEENKRN